MDKSTNWLSRVEAFQDLDWEAKSALSRLQPSRLPAGEILFRPGDETKGFPVVLEGYVGVYLTGPNGREILLYGVNAGQSCVQSTLGLLGGAHYTGEAITQSAVEVVLIPKSTFDHLLANSDGFRRYLFGAFAFRMQTVMQLLERVAFIKVEERLAELLLERADTGGLVGATHQELATAIGSAREVVSRRLEAFAKKDLVALERGHVKITNETGLRRLAGLSSRVSD